MKTLEVTAAIIRQNGKVLICQRPVEKNCGLLWEFPGGKIEANETSEQALIREIKEELDIDIEVNELIDRIEYDYPDFHLSMDCFWCKIIGGHLVLKEASNAKWLTKANIDSVSWLAADRLIIDQIKGSL